MIVRMWRGETASGKAGAYAQLMLDRAIPDYRTVPGNLAAWCLRRDRGAVVEFLMLTLWRDMEAIRAFAGADVATARYYDFDPEFLIEMTEEVEHFERLEPAVPTGLPD